MRKIISVCVAVVSLGVLVASGTVLFRYLRSGNEDLSGYYNSSEQTAIDNKSELCNNPINFAELKAHNPDVCGWIRIEGTKVDYPILRSGKDVEEGFYLNHGLDRQKKNTGSIYIEKVNAPDFSDPVTVIYGHNMRNGSMFASVTNFRNQEFFDANPNIYIYTEGHIIRYEVFSAFLHNDNHLMYDYDFYDKNSYKEFLEGCLNPKTGTKCVKKDVTVDAEDKMIVLSTCFADDDERFLVVARKAEDILTK